MIFFTILLIVLVVGSVTAGFFAPSVPFLGAIYIPLIIICVIIGIVWATFVGIKIYNDVHGKK